MTHVQEVMGSNPGTVYWMDLHYITLKEKLKIKEAKWGTPKKYFFLNVIIWLMLPNYPRSTKSQITMNK